MTSKGTVHQVLSVLTVTLNEMNIGIGNGWTAPVLKTLKVNSTNEELSFSFNDQESAWVAALDNIGRIIGAIVSALLIDILGRKRILISCAVIFMLNWLVILFTKSVLIVCLVRIFFGLAKGMNDCTNSVYVGENTSPVFRGIFGTVASACYYGALLLEYIVATYISYNGTAIVNAAVGLLTCVTTLWIKEPAHFLLMKGKHEKAVKNYLWLKGAKSITHLNDDFELIKENVKSERVKRASPKEIFTSSANYKSFVIVFVIYVLVGAIGFAPIVAFTSLMFEKTSFLSENQFTILFGALQFLVAISTSCVISSFNRRSIITVSTVLIMVMHLFTAALYYIHENVSPISCFPWLIFCGITMFASIYSFMYPAIFLIRSELFPLSIKAVGGSVSLIGNSGTSFLTTWTFFFIKNRYGIHVNFIIFALVSLFTIIFVYFTLPETRNKTLIDIQNELEKKTKKKLKISSSYVEVPAEDGAAVDVK